ncbi:MAG TPA: preprotein translocase subunit YajC [Segeticoccus sp.]|nr:preprotein translocase subunit YajC [Segeticoccus sp.]
MSSLAAAANSSGGSMGSLLIFAIPILLIGFMFWSQRRRQRTMQQQQAALEVGDEGRTTSGLYGTIIALDDRIATLEVSPGVQVRFDRRAVLAAPTAAEEPATDTGSTAAERQDTDLRVDEESDGDASSSSRTSGE